MRTLGRQLRELRKAKNLTLRELAERAGLDFTYLSKIENDRPGYRPSESAIRDLAKQLDADADELVLLANRLPRLLEKKITKVPHAQTFLMSASSLSAEDWQAVDALVQELRKKKRR